ncbi:MAG: DUF1501 domain-containing protein [Pseudomonadota bacterium]
MDRRLFLKGAALAGAGTALGHLPGVAYSEFVGTANALPGYRALVCVFLFGGNDSCNMVVPRSAPEHEVYARSRQNLAIARDQLLPITALNPDGALYGLHPSMPGVQRLFEQGACAVVANVGPLVQPVTRAQYLNESVPLPPQLFSHNDQQDQWQTLKGRSTVRSGWAGRIADALDASAGGGRVPVNVSLGGTVVQQVGERTVPYNVGRTNAPEFTGLGGTNALTAARRTAFESLLDGAESGIHGRAFASVERRAITTAASVNAALAPLATAPAFTTAFPASGLGAQLQMVARLIAVRDALQVSRQVFFVATGGFDTHDDQLDDHPVLLADLSASLAAFHDALAQMRVTEQVIALTQSDFGRTLTSNGDGTDHGWGSHQLVVGGGVLGRRIYGTMPRLEIGGPDDTSGGRIIPTTAVDQLVGTLARWLGVADAQIDAIAPNLRNFPQRFLPFV